MQAVTVDRDKYIGGSDIPIIMGISPFKSRYDLLLEKAGLKEDNFNGNEYTEYGNIMEEKIRNYINSQGLSKKIYKEDKKIIGNIRCHVDGFNGETVLEIKTTGRVYDDVDDYKIYLVQLLFYMQYMGVSKGLLAIYKRPQSFNKEFDSNKLTTYYIDIDNYKELLEKINDSVEQFIIDLEKIKKNPFITEEELLPVDLTELSNQVVAIENKLIEMKKLEEQAKELKSQLKIAMEEHNKKKWETPTGIKITLVEDTPDKEIEEEFYNEKKFIIENPELNETYHKKMEEYKETRTITKKGRNGYIKITLPKGE